MKLTRYFFISDDLDDLESFEEDLEEAGIVTPQIHLLTLDDTGAANHHHLHKMTSFMKTDIVHSTLIGAALGIVTSILALIVTHSAGWSETRAGWIPFLFLAVGLLGFCTWQGGLWGIQRRNVHFKRFDKALQDGRHVFFVDLEPSYDEIVRRVSENHPTVSLSGLDRGAPNWLVYSQYHIRRFFTETFP